MCLGYYFFKSNKLGKEVRVSGSSKVAECLYERYIRKNDLPIFFRKKDITKEVDSLQFIEHNWIPLSLMNEDKKQNSITLGEALNEIRSL